MDEKKKVKFNVIDAIVILVIVAAVALVGYKVVGGRIGGSDADTYTVKFSCDEVPDFAATIIQVGDEVVDEQKDVPLGTVTDVKLDGSRTYTTTSDGDIRIVPKQYYYSVELTTTLKANEYEHGLMVNSSKYGVGHSITIRVGKAKIFGRVSYIEKVEE